MDLENCILYFRVAGVLQEMEAIQKREADETAALENMIQQVEANLQTTTVSAAMKDQAYE